MSFFGKEYVYDKEENFDTFVNSLGIPATVAQGFLNYRPSYKFVQDGDSYTLISSTAETKKEVNFKSGVTFDDKVAERNCKTTYTLDGNTLTQVEKFEDGAEFKFVRVFSDTDLVATITSSKFDGTARRYYKAV